MRKIWRNKNLIATSPTKDSKLSNFVEDNKSVHKEESLHSNFQFAQETKGGSILFSDLLDFVSDVA